MAARKRARADVRTNLRPPPSSFVGRHRELDALTEAFEEARLVTLVGPGGIGKTRLALRHAENRLGVFAKRGRGGVWIVDLADTRSMSEAVGAIAIALHVSLAGQPKESAMSEAVGAALGRLGPALVVLDNVEQIAIPFARHLDRWMASAPSARFLVTSRVVLGLPVERAQVLGPLTTDDARLLFLDRAKVVRALSLDEREATLLGGIVDAIDRMPLAIELAAARTRVLSASELRARLVRPLEVLAGGVTNDRHVSIRGVVLDSVALLDATQRRAFALLATLDDDFTAAMAEAVLSVLGLERGAVLEVLDALVRTSLLRADVQGESTRHAFFETIREVAEELRSREPLREAASEAHAAYHAALTREMTSDDPRARASVARDLPHFLAARRYAASLGRGDDVIALTLTVEPVLTQRGLSSLRVTLLDDALERITDLAGTARRAELHLARGLARRELGDGGGATADFDAALALTDPALDAGLRATALLRVGAIADLRGDTVRARARFAEALDLLATTPPGATRSTREAEAFLRLGHAHRREGALDDATAAFERAATRHRELGLDDGLVASLYELGVVEMFRERVEAAFAYFDEGLIVARRSGARIMEGACLTARGCLLQDLGRLDEALFHHAEAARIFHDHASRYREASALYYLATTYLERGDADEARALIEQARVRIEGVGAPRYDVLLSGACALALAARGHHDEAQREAARATRAIASVPHEPALDATQKIHRLTLAARAQGEASPEVLARARALVLASPSDDSRFALRELERALGLATVEARDALCVWGAGEAFLTPGGTKLTLPPRSPMRRILDRLVTQRERAPGEPVALDALIAAGWPDEKIGTEAALNRAYVALSNLRKRGLRDAIVSVGGGYAISRAFVVRRMGSPRG